MYILYPSSTIRPELKTIADETVWVVILVLILKSPLLDYPTLKIGILSNKYTYWKTFT